MVPFFSSLLCSDGLIKRKGAGYVLEKRKLGATPSNTSAVDDLEDTAVEDDAVFETAPPADRTHDTSEQARTAIYSLQHNHSIFHFLDSSSHLSIPVVGVKRRRPPPPPARRDPAKRPPLRNKSMCPTKVS
jgi:hypothetical protein